MTHDVLAKPLPTHTYSRMVSRVKPALHWVDSLWLLLCCCHVLLLQCWPSLQKRSEQACLARQDLGCTHLAHVLECGVMIIWNVGYGPALAQHAVSRVSLEAANDS